MPEHRSQSGRAPQAPDHLQPVGRNIARLLDRAAETHWRGYQLALLHGDPERALVLEGRARRYEEMRDLCHAYMWQPKVRPARLSSAERAELHRLVYARRSQQRPEKRRSFSVVHHGAHHGAGDECTNVHFTKAYGWEVLCAECRRVADTPAGNRNNVLASASFKVGQRVGADLLDHDTAYGNLLGAALACGLSERESRPVIRSGLRAGECKPKPIPERNTA
jgi:hypothetical protein